MVDIQAVEGRPPRFLPFVVLRKTSSRNGYWLALSSAAASPPCIWALMKTKHRHKAKAPSPAMGHTGIPVFAVWESIAGF